jgi:uncharacterized protein YcfL
MKKTLLALSLLIMAGCSSMQDLGRSQRQMLFQSKKQIDAVAECILAGWQKKAKNMEAFLFNP